MRKVLCVLATSLALPAGADTIGPYDNIFVFGDSLSDSGNIATALGKNFPSAIYPNGQFTNGDAWTTQLGLSASLTGGTNYAYGGARARDNGDTTPDLLRQIRKFGRYTEPAQAENALGVIWAGGNDFRDIPSTAGEAEVAAMLGSIVGSISTGALNLAARGVNDVVIMGLPDFGALPAFAGDAEGAAAASFVTGQLNAALAGTVADLDATLGANVNFFDTNAIFQDILANTPEATRQVRCLDDIADCTANPGDYVFYDDLHPVEGVHTQLAEAFAEEFLSEVPLPAGAILLLTGLAGFGVWGKRRKSLA